MTASPSQPSPTPPVPMPPTPRTQRPPPAQRWAAQLGAFFAVSLVNLFLCQRRFADDPDQHALALLLCGAPLWLFAAALLTKARAMPRIGRLSGFAFAGALLSLAVYWPRFPADGIASPVYRSLLIGPFLALLAAAVGATLTYIFWGDGTLEKRWGFEAFIGVRDLRSLRGSVLSVVTMIALLGVILGVSLLVVSLAILSGFEGDLIEKIIGSHAHLVASKRPGYTIDAGEAEAAEATLHRFGAIKTSRFVNAEMLVASDTNHNEAHLYGIDVTTAPEVFAVLRKIVKGGLAHLAREGQGAEALPPPTEIPEVHRVTLPPRGGAGPATIFPEKRPTTGEPALPGILIGVEMARQLHVDLGDRLTLVSPIIEELTPQGLAPKTKVFRVAGVFDSKMYDYDAHNIYISLADAQAFIELGRDIGGVAAAFADPPEAEKVSAKVLAALGGYPFQVVSWQARNRSLFMSLKLEKAVAFIVLIFIVLVASFSIVNTLTMSVIEKAREIAILKTMGAKEVSVSKIFVVQGAVVGVVGTLIGAGVGVGLALLLRRFGVYIDPDVYYVDRLPVRLHVADVLQVCVLAMLMTSLSAIFPALAGARLPPVEGLRYE